MEKYQAQQAHEIKLKYKIQTINDNIFTIDMRETMEIILDLNRSCFKNMR